MADRRSLSRDLLGFIGNDKIRYKKCFLAAAGAVNAQHRPGLQSQTRLSAAHSGAATFNVCDDTNIH